MGNYTPLIYRGAIQTIQNGTGHALRYYAHAISVWMSYLNTFKNFRAIEFDNDTLTPHPVFPLIHK